MPNHYPIVEIVFVKPVSSRPKIPSSNLRTTHLQLTSLPLLRMVRVLGLQTRFLALGVGAPTLILVRGLPARKSKVALFMASTQEPSIMP